MVSGKIYFQTFEECHFTWMGCLRCIFYFLSSVGIEMLFFSPLEWFLSCISGGNILGLDKALCCE